MATIGYQPWGRVASATNFTNRAIDDNAKTNHVLTQALTTDPITKVLVRIGTKTGTTPTYKVSLHGADAAGAPNAAILGGGSPASATFNPSGLGWADNSAHWVTLDNAYTPTRGLPFFIRIKYDSGTVDGSNNAEFTYACGNEFLGTHFVLLDGALSAFSMPYAGYATASRKYGFTLKDQANVTFNSGTNPKEYGMKFTLPAGMGDTFAAAVLSLSGTIAVGSTVTVRIYQGGNAGDTTVLQTCTFDTDLQANADFGGEFRFPFTDAALAALNCGGTYRWAVEAGAGDVTITILEVESADDWDAMGAGQQMMLTTRNGGNWTDTATKQIGSANLILTDITEPSAAAKLIMHNYGNANIWVS